ncbi:hypothetical protein AC73_3357 [Escherichia coli 2-427-07_S4_C1]|nr:hypothetical protein AC73_3357 [Escherichia coli 2-427-07_S4_C1]
MSHLIIEFGYRQNGQFREKTFTQSIKQAQLLNPIVFSS